jgi:hypothetical protein
MKVIAGLLAFLALVGCATSEDSKSKEPPAKVTVYRQPSTQDSFFRMKVAIDGRPIGGLYPDEEISFDVPPGDHRLQYELGVYNCAADVNLESGKAYSYRLARGCVIELEDGSAPDPAPAPDTRKWADEANEQVEDTE